MTYIERTRDLAIVRAIITRPAQWRAATDDGAPARDEWQPNADERIIYLHAVAPGMAGIFTLIPQNAICYEIHCGFASWAKQEPGATTAMLRAAIGWTFKNSGAKRIVASIPATNTAAIALARRASLVEFGRNPQSFLKRGRLLDQILLGISAE